MIQPKKSGFRTPQDFLAAAVESPEQVFIDPASNTVTVAPAAPDAAPEGGEAEVLTAAEPQAPSEPEPAPAPAPAPAPKPKTVRVTKAPTVPAAAANQVAAPESSDAPAEAPAAGKAAPWDSESPTERSGGYNLRVSKRLHAKLAWCAENVPKHKSIAVVMERACEEYADKLIAKFYNPEDGV